MCSGSLPWLRHFLFPSCVAHKQQYQGRISKCDLCGLQKTQMADLSIRNLWVQDEVTERAPQHSVLCSGPVEESPGWLTGCVPYLWVPGMRQCGLALGSFTAAGSMVVLCSSCGSWAEASPGHCQDQSSFHPHRWGSVARCGLGKCLRSLSVTQTGKPGELGSVAPEFHLLPPVTTSEELWELVQATGT